jgi:hypothetical protein
MADFNIFSTPDYYGGLLGQETVDKLQKQALTTGLVNAALGFIAQPRNQRYGSALPYLGKALAAGYQSGQDVIAGGLRDYETKQKIEEMQRKKEQQQAQQQFLQQYASRLPENQRAAVLAYPELGAKIAEVDIIPGKRETTIAPNGQLIYKDTGELVTQQSFAAPKEEKPAGTKVVGNSLVNELTGQVIYTAPKGETLPTSAQEYEYAQRDPKFAAFLAQRDKSRQTTINLPSESERTSGFLTSRLQNALGQINQVVSKNPQAASPKLGAEAVKLFTGSDYLKNLTNPATRQQVEAAQLELLDSALTLGTGAAYTREQLMNYQKSYFPQLGDKQSTVADKQERLKALLNAAKIKAGRAAPEDMGLPAGVSVERVK